MLNMIIIAVVVLIAALFAFAATRPNTLRVRRATRIKAPPERIFALINDLRSFRSWSPYEMKDPAMRRSHRGPAYGKGAVYEWDGNKEIGKGSLEITESSPPSRITMKLDFIRPFEAHNIVEFTLEPEGGSTNVAWTMHGPMPYISKVMSVFINMDRMVGKDFEAGLARLKAVAETQAPAAISGLSKSA